MPKDTREEREMKVKVLRIYNEKLRERVRRKEVRGNILYEVHSFM